MTTPLTPVTQILQAMATTLTAAFPTYTVQNQPTLTPSEVMIPVISIVTVHDQPNKGAGDSGKYSRLLTVAVNVLLAGSPPVDVTEPVMYQIIDTLLVDTNLGYLVDDIGIGEITYLTGQVTKNCSECITLFELRYTIAR